MSSANAPSIESTQSALAAHFQGDNVPSVPHQAPEAPQGDTDYGQLSGYDPQGTAPTPHYPGQAPEQQPQDGRPPAMVPSHRLREATERARELEAQNHQLVAYVNQQHGQLRELSAQVQQLVQIVNTARQQPAAPAPQPQQVMTPELFDNPRGFADSLITQVRDAASTAAQSVTEQSLANERRQMLTMKLQVSDTIAEAKYGRDAIRIATNAAKAAGLMNEFLAKASPVVAAIEWYNSQVAAQRYGTTPTDIRQAVFAELVQDPNMLAQLVAVAQGRGQPQAPGGQVPQPQPTSQQPQLPPSLSAAPRGAVPFPANPQATTVEALRGHFNDARNKRLHLVNQ